MCRDGVTTTARVADGVNLRFAIAFHQPYDDILPCRMAAAVIRSIPVSYRYAEVTGGECRSCYGAHDEEGGEYRVARRSSPDGRELRGIRHPLEPLVAGRLSEEVQADGDEFFRVAWEHGP